MVALGADDFSISIWRNNLHKPLVVLHDIFNRPLLDLCWCVGFNQAPHLPTDSQGERRSHALRLFRRWNHLRRVFQHFGDTWPSAI